MESTVQIESGSQAEEREGQILPPSKRIKLNKVAEMVLVLAAMGKMRNGGVRPSDAEIVLMEEAKDGLAGVCEGFAPGKVFPKDMFGSLIDDLGLSGLKDQNLGYHPPKLSISEKMLISKRKMEKAQEISILSSAQSYQHLQGNSSSVEERGTLHPAKSSQMAKSNQIHASSGNFSLVGSTGKSTSLPYQLPTSEMKPTVSTAVPRAGRPQMNLDGRINDPITALPAQAHYSTNSSAKAPSWSMQPHTVQTAKIGSGNQSPSDMALKVEGVGHGLSPQMTSTVTNLPTTAVPPPQGTKQVFASLAYNHSEIGKIIQKILKPKDPEQRAWVPPSRDYMSKALTCQMCMATVTEIHSILICDACEKGYHLKCLQSINQRDVSTGEWHCRKCLSLSNGKPLALKYGRVMKNMNTSKTSSSNSGAVKSTSSKDVGASRDISQPVETVNGSTSVQNIPAAVSTHSHQVSGTRPNDATKIQDNNVVANKVEADGKVSSGRSQNIIMKTSDSAYFLVNSPVDTICDEKMVELKLNTPSKLDKYSDSSAMLNNHDGKIIDLKSSSMAKLEVVSDSSNKSLFDETMMVEDLQNSEAGKIFNPDSGLSKDREDRHHNPPEIASSSGSINHNQSLSDGSHVVNWVGDPVQDSKEKIHYVSCSINGQEYRVMEHVLIRFDNGKLVPSKLQVMWEDKATRKKWVTVNRCYFPGDFPETVGRPCGMESNEVCESSYGSTLPANLIEKSCQVLPARKFAEEYERRKNSGTQQNLPPLYMCRWIYDEAKGLFRDFSC